MDDKSVPSEIYVKRGDHNGLVLTTEHDPDATEFIKEKLYHSIDKIRLRQAEYIRYLRNLCEKNGINFDS